jgi:hypothetical protein
MLDADVIKEGVERLGTDAKVEAQRVYLLDIAHYPLPTNLSWKYRSGQDSCRMNVMRH